MALHKWRHYVVVGFDSLREHDFFFKLKC